MAKTVSKKQTDFWQGRSGNLAIGVLALLVTYLIGSRAIDTGSLQQYTLTLLFLALAINRFIKTIRS
ncbi:MAG TPA: hypothetical protein VLF90_03980 [Patescibacteria group bacterium]|nr:hypothetical protein [Patescibacteria group bacterium]